MRYLRKYNEELDGKTYLDAARKLGKLGHKNRVSKLKDWAKKSAYNSLRKGIESLGTFELTIDSTDYGSTYTGEFYIDLQFDEDQFNDRYYNWICGDVTDLWVDFNISILPVDDSFKKHDSASSGEISEKLNGSYGVGEISIHLGNIPEDLDNADMEKVYQIYQKDKYSSKIPHVVNPLGKISMDYWDVPFYFTDRKSASRFRKGLIDIFKGNIVYKETSKQPGGLKEEIIDFLISDNNYLDFDEFQIWLERLGRININRLYKD